VRAFCSERDGGVSAAPYDTLNLGDHVGDDEPRWQRTGAAMAAELQAGPCS
jgi:copper oxidase (laccase) domain-containing protein